MRTSDKSRSDPYEVKAVLLTSLNRQLANHDSVAKFPGIERLPYLP